MCTYTESDHALPHWKCLWRCCAKCPCINIPDQEIDNPYSETTPSIRFHIYHIIWRWTYYGRISSKDKKYVICENKNLSSDNSTKIYTRKELVMTETTIYDLHTSFYIPSIQKLAFHLRYVRIVGTNHCGAMQRTAFKWREIFQVVLCCRDYSKRVLARFYNQIQSKYYGGNISASLYGIALEHFNALPKADINSTAPSRERHVVFHSLLSGDSIQVAATNTAHSKRLISLLKDKKYWHYHWLQYRKTLMVVSKNTDVSLHCT